MLDVALALRGRRLADLFFFDSGKAAANEGLFDLLWPFMSLASLLSDFSNHLQSDQFRLTARHPDHPTAFQRRRKLPLPSLVALMLTGMRKSVQTELDEFFGHLQQQAQLTHQVSAQAFAQARSKLATTAMPELND